MRTVSRLHCITFFTYLIINSESLWNFPVRYGPGQSNRDFNCWQSWWPEFDLPRLMLDLLTLHLLWSLIFPLPSLIPIKTCPPKRTQSTDSSIPKSSKWSTPFPIQEFFEQAVNSLEEKNTLRLSQLHQRKVRGLLSLSAFGSSLKRRTGGVEVRSSCNPKATPSKNEMGHSSIESFESEVLAPWA